MLSSCAPFIARTFLTQPLLSLASPRRHLAALRTTCLWPAPISHFGWVLSCDDPKIPHGVEFYAGLHGDIGSCTQFPFVPLVSSCSRVMCVCRVMDMCVRRCICTLWPHICDLRSDIRFVFRHVIYTRLYGRGNWGGA